VAQATFYYDFNSAHAYLAAERRLDQAAIVKSS
jgi:hypothetical protein